MPGVTDGAEGGEGVGEGAGEGVAKASGGFVETAGGGAAEAAGGGVAGVTEEADPETDGVDSSVWTGHSRATGVIFRNQGAK